MLFTRKGGNMSKVVVYIRVSSQDQAKSGLGLLAQWRACRRFCEERGFRIVRVVRDNGVSAGTPLRKRRNGRFLLDLDAGTNIVALNMDRLFRSILDYLVTEEEWRESGVECWFVDGEKLDTSEPELWFAQCVRVLAAELERRLAGKRTKRALAVAKTKGIVPGPKVQDDPEVVENILIFSRAGKSNSDIACRLNMNGFRTTTGAEFTHVQVRRILDRAERQILQ